MKIQNEKNKKNKNNFTGFTLIELVIATSLIILLTGLGIASYNNFNETQTLKQTALVLKNNLRFAQNKALNGEKICGYSDRISCGGENDQVCDGDGSELPLSGWEVKLLATSYKIYGVCDSTEFSLKTYNLPSEVTLTFPLSPNNIIRFKPLSAGLTNSTNICLSGFGKRYKLSLTSSGEIKDYGIVSVCP